MSLMEPCRTGRAAKATANHRSRLWTTPVLLPALAAGLAACSGAESNTSGSSLPADSGVDASAETSVEAAASNTKALCDSTCTQLQGLQSQCKDVASEEFAACEARCIDQGGAAHELGCGGQHDALIGCFATPGAFACSDDGQSVTVAQACIDLSNQYQSCTEPPDPVPETLCQAGKMSLSGSVEATTVSVSEPAGFYMVTDEAGLWKGSTHLFPTAQTLPRPSGQLRTWGSWDLGTGHFAPIRGILRFPTQQGPDGWWCGANESTFLSVEGNSHRVRLRNLQSLGTCPGQPVQGEITVCLANTEDCGAGNIPGTEILAHTMKSTVAGTEFERTFMSTAWAAGPDSVDFSVLGGLGFGWVEVDGNFGVTGGLLQLPEPAKDVGGLYCISDSSAVEPYGFPPTRVRMTLRVSRLGKCGEGKPAAGSVDACYLGDSSH